MFILKSGITYFLLVFAAGFMLGVVRTLFVAPIMGEIYAELVEIPFMVLLIYLFSNWVIKKFDVPYTVNTRTVIGLLALILLLAAEVALVIFMGDVTIGEYIQNKNNVSGLAYAVSLFLYTVFPLFVQRKIGA